jgi:hypothetical protein
MFDLERLSLESDGDVREELGGPDSAGCEVLEVILRIGNVFDDVGHLISLVWVLQQTLLDFL